MKLNKVSVNETLSKAESILKEEQGLSPSIRAIIEILILFIKYRDASALWKVRVYFAE